jgi:hypothetical protein
MIHVIIVIKVILNYDHKNQMNHKNHSSDNLKRRT